MFQSHFVPTTINYQHSKSFCTLTNQLASFRIIFYRYGLIIKIKICLYLHQAIIKFQNHFVRTSIKYQVSKSMCTNTTQWSSIRILFQSHGSVIKFQNNFVPVSINYQVSKQYWNGIVELSNFRIILYPHGSIINFIINLYRLWSIIKFQNNFLPASINYQVLE